ncbi:MAG: ribonuclease H-like domain-containing protein [Leptonema sp. (in: bacteria)]
MSIFLSNNRNNAYKKDFNEIYENYLKKWDLLEIEEGIYLRKKQYKIYDEQLENIFPFTGILEVLGKLNDVKPNEILFFDLETTNKDSFSVSNLPFFMGFGYYQDGFFHLKQIFFLDSSKEVIALNYINNFIKKFKYIATYNGKRFDVPLLKNRFIYYSKEFIESFQHFDLFVFWKRLLPKQFEGGYSQKNLERKILQIYRENDIDGSEVPKIYYDAIHYDQIDDLYKVILHNEWDVYHLFLLMIESLRILKNKKLQNLELAKLFFRNKMYNESINILEKLKQNLGQNQEKLAVYDILYKTYWKLQDWEKAVKYLKEKLNYKKNPKEYLMLIRILQNKLKKYKEAIYYLEELMEFIGNFPEIKSQPYLKMNSLVERKRKLEKYESKTNP